MSALRIKTVTQELEKEGQVKREVTQYFQMFCKEEVQFDQGGNLSIKAMYKILMKQTNCCLNNHTVVPNPATIFILVPSSTKLFSIVDLHSAYIPLFLF